MVLLISDAFELFCFAYSIAKLKQLKSGLKTSDISLIYLLSFSSAGLQTSNFSSSGLNEILIGIFLYS